LMIPAPAMYLAGMATVVTALGIGFGGAMLLTSTTKPVQKEPAAAFAKREQPVVVETTAAAPAVAPAPTVSAAVTAPAAAYAAAPQYDLIPAVPTSAEKVMALDYAPPSPVPPMAATTPTPAPMATPAPSPQATPQPVVASPKPIIVPETTGSAEASASQKREKMPKVEKKRTPTEVVKPEKKKTMVAERKRRPAPIVEDDDDDEPRMSLAAERPQSQPKGFFGFLFDN
jgi:hypothetical protein